MEFDDKLPIYIQLAALLTGKIISGQWVAGSKVDSVRDLAVAYQVNPNTVQRALAEMEREGLVHTERTSGRFVTTDEGRLKEAQATRAAQEVAAFVREMKKLGYEPEECIRLLTQFVEEGVAGV